MATNKIPARKRLSTERHHSEYQRQILLPILLVALGFAGLTGWLAYAGLGGAVNLANLSDISLIWLMLPTFIGGLAVLAALGAMVYGMAALLRNMPAWTGTAQDYVYLFTDKVQAAAAQVTRRVISLRAWADYFGKRERN